MHVALHSTNKKSEIVYIVLQSIHSKVTLQKLHGTLLFQKHIFSLLHSVIQLNNQPFLYEDKIKKN